MSDEKPKDPVRAALHQAAQTNYTVFSSAQHILRYEKLNPEQQLAYAMSALENIRKPRLP